MKVSIFTSIKQTTKPQHTSTKTVLDLIRTGGKQKEFLMALREMPEDEYKKRKTELPIILFGGTFSQRNKESLMGGSGLLTLDFDGVEDLTGLRDELTSKPYMYSVFLSPSGRGYKALVRIPIVKTDEEYKKYFAALKREFKTVDVSGKDISRSCFFSYDPEIYINTNCELWDTKYETPKQKTENKPYQVKNGAWGNINTALRKIEDSIEGEKHNVRTKIAYLFGGYVSSGSMTYEDAYRLLEGAVSKNTSDLKSAMQTIKDCLDAGMAEPLNMTEQRRVLDMKVGLGRKYKPMSETFDGVRSFYEKGYQRGWEIGWSVGNPYVSLLRGSYSIWHGQPFSGKSQVIHEILVNIVKWEVNNGNEDIYIAMLSPETGDVNQVYGELISIAAQQSFIGDYKMDEDTMIKWADFISKHFIVIDFEGETASTQDLFQQVEAIEREFGIKVSIVSIDPANYLSVDEGRHSRRDLAVGKDLDFILADARKNNRHNIVVTHDRDQQIQTNKDGQMYFPMAHAKQMMEGQQLHRKGMLIVCVYRPLDIKGRPLPNDSGIPAEENETQVWIQKAKPRGCSEVGMFKLFYDFKKNCYYEIDDLGREYYAWGEPRNESAQPLQINPDSEQETKAVRWGSELKDVKNEADSHTPF